MPQGATPADQDPRNPSEDPEFGLRENLGKNSQQDYPSVLLPWEGCRYDYKAFRFESILLFVLSMALLAGASFWPGFHCSHCWQGIIWVAVIGAILVLWGYQILKIFYLHWTVQYRLDRERLLIKHGLIRQTTDTVLIAQINDIKMTQTLWDRLINGGVGTISVFSSDTTDPQLKLSGIDKPRDAFETLDHLRKEYVARRGIKSFGTGDGGTGAGF